MSWLWQMKGSRHGRGYAIVLTAVLMMALIIFLGLVIDLGFAYVTQANLSKAVDAAALTGVRNFSSGNSAAESIALSSFQTNYGSTGRDVSKPVVSATFSPAPGTDLNYLNVSATATIQTFFIGVIPQWKTLNVSASAQAIRAPVAMSLILDRSGSMQNNGGWSNLAPAVDSFIGHFDDNIDEASLATFSSDATLNVPMEHNFQTDIKADTPQQYGDFGGGTFSEGGFVIGKQQLDGVAASANLVKVAIFFTDGYANIIQQNLACRPVATTWNFGGYDTGTDVGFFVPANGNEQCTENGGQGCCTGPTKFKTLSGSTQSFNRQNVTNEAMAEVVNTADAMRAEGIIVYSMGLGDEINESFLYQVANDPSPADTAYNPNQPAGKAYFAPTAQQLQQLWSDLAADIEARLTR